MMAANVLLSLDGTADLDGLVSVRNEGAILREAGRLRASAITFLPRDICKALGVTPRSLNTYARNADVNRPKRGERSFRYSHADRKAICSWVAANVSDTRVVERARQVLDETETKPKDGK
jgi:hypothetical protein